MITSLYVYLSLSLIVCAACSHVVQKLLYILLLKNYCYPQFTWLSWTLQVLLCRCPIHSWFAKLHKPRLPYNHLLKTVPFFSPEGKLSQWSFICSGRCNNGGQPLQYCSWKKNSLKKMVCTSHIWQCLGAKCKIVHLQSWQVVKVSEHASKCHKT